MSLINQALKKRQRDRGTFSEGLTISPKVEPTAAPRRATYAESLPGYKLLYWVVGGGMIAAGIISAVALVIVVLKPTPLPPAVEPLESESSGIQVRLQAPEKEGTIVEAQPAPTVETSPVPSASQPEPQVARMEPPVQQPTVVKDIPAEPSPSTPSQAVPARPPVVAPTETDSSLSASTSTSTPVAAVKPTLIAEQPVKVGKAEDEKPEPPPPAEPIPGAEPNPNVLAFLESSRITGIKVAGKQSRLLMNNHVFKTNSIVQPETKLRITEIKSNEILFVDESGIQYRKQFQR